METKILLMVLALLSPHVTEVINARSPLQFSGRSLLSKDQRAALLKLVQGPNAKLARTPVKKTQVIKPVVKAPVVETRDSNLVQSRVDVTNDIEDGQLDSEGCMKKIVMVEEVEFDTEIKCQHVSQESCFESYTTTFKKTKTEECDESFKKECEIEYHKVPKEEKVEICNEMLTRNCEVDGPEVCSKEYETVCETKYEEHTVEEMVPDCKVDLVERCMTDPETEEEWCDNVPKRECTIVTKPSVKLTPKTECRKEVAEVCGPETCPIVKGDRVCKDEIQTVIHEVPQESCTMVPRKVCNIVSKVVPTLEPVKHCIEIPKEMCAKSRINPVRKTRPVVRKWCLNEKEKKLVTLENLVYVLSSVPPVGGQAGTPRQIKAQLVDTTTGLPACGKTIEPDQQFEQSDLNGAIYNLLGDARELVACGLPTGQCAKLNIGTGEVTRADIGQNDVINAPGPFAAPFVDLIDGSWLAVGGFSGDEVDLESRHTSIFTTFADLKFTDTPLSSNFADPELGDRGCLLKFASQDAPVVFYATTLNKNSDGYGNTVFAIKRGDKVRINYGGGSGGIPESTLGDQPTCGYAVVTNDDLIVDERTIGDTVVYFLTSTPRGVMLNIIKVPTGSEDSMASYMEIDDPLPYGDFLSAKLSGVDDPDRNVNGEEGENARKFASVWLGDNRSLLFPSFESAVYVFDANFDPINDPDNEFVDYLPQPDSGDRDDSANVLFACRATQADKDNLGCE